MFENGIKHTQLLMRNGWQNTFLPIDMLQMIESLYKNVFVGCFIIHKKIVKIPWANQKP
jgi:hypothetical protein